MPRKTIIIFITVFIIVGAVILGFYYYKNSNKTTLSNTTNSEYNPFSSGSPTNTTNTTSDINIVGGDTTVPTDSGEQPVPQVSKFRQITTFAVSGATYFEDTRLLPVAEPVVTSPDTTTPPATKKKVVAKPIPPKFEIVPSLRYVERVTGHIYQMYLDTKVEGKVSNSTIPAIYEAIFDGKAQTVIYRYLAEDGATINSFMATLGGTNGEFLPANILDVSLSPDKSKFFYLIKTSNGVVGTTRVFGETKSTQVFSSSFSEWLSQWVGSQKIYLTTKASAQAVGNLFSVNTATGSMTKIFGGVIGLTTLGSSDGSLILYSTTLATGPRLGIFNVSRHTTMALDVFSLAEKCLWTKDNSIIYCAVPNNIGGGQYPDSWYKGQASFDDHFMKIDPSTGIATLVADPGSETPVDGTHLFLNKAEDQLFFINKKNSTLWSLNLK